MTKTTLDQFIGTNVQNFPARHAASVSPSDTVDLAVASKCLYVGGAGDLAMIMVDDADSQSVTLKAVPVGTVLNVQVRRVLNTGTTATNIVVLWG